MFSKKLPVAAALFISGISASCLAGESDLSLWETGGMYFCVPYSRGSTEVDLNAWHEDKAPGYSLYGSYAFSDHSTLKLEVPVSFESSPYVQGMKVTELYGIQVKGGDRTLSGDANVEYYFGEGWNQFIPTIGCNAAKRWGTFALLSRIGGGVSILTENSKTSFGRAAEAEVGPFIYTGDLGMIGLPLMFEYGDNEASVNCAIDWELYLPKGFSLWIVPRYEVHGNSGFSIWTGIAWLKTPD
jgi:hypothetical protein